MTPRRSNGLADRLRGRDWRSAFPETAEAYDPLGGYVEYFDYVSEDRRPAERSHNGPHRHGS